VGLGEAHQLLHVQDDIDQVSARASAGLGVGASLAKDSALK
jgi:hypothetical protein